MGVIIIFKKTLSIILAIMIAASILCGSLQTFAADAAFKNGGFENGLGSGTYWAGNKSVFTANTTASNIRTGRRSLHVSASNHQVLYQTFNLSYNTKYAISFWYKGNLPDKVALWSITAGDTYSFDSAETFSKGCLGGSTENWTQNTAVILTGNKNQFTLAFQSTYDTDFYIDDVTITTTTDNAEEVPSYTAPSFIESLSRTMYDDKPYVCDDGKNLFPDKGFENSYNYGGAFIRNGVSSIVTEEAFKGEKSYKFVSGNTQESAYYPFDVEPNSEYILTGFLKSPMYSDTNTCDASVGIMDPDTGDFILFTGENEETKRLYNSEKQSCFTGDNYWHYFSVKIYSGSLDRLAFGIKGKNTTLYLDDIYVFKDEKNAGKRFMSKLESDAQTNVSVTNANPTNTEVNSADKNIVDNGDLSEGEEGWANEKCYSFGKTLNVEDIGSSSYGNVLHYKNDMKHPNKIYYIKWIDVEKDTEYTFSADVMIIKADGGNLGLLSGYRSDNNSEVENIIYPTSIWTYDFSAENLANQNNWERVGVTFNSEDRNRVGIAVFDNGGEALIDNLQVFKSNYGIVPTVKPIESGSIESLTEIWKVSNGDLTGINKGTTVGEIKLRLADGDHIYVTDAQGNRITDETVVVENGMKVTLCDGYIVIDSLDLVIGNENYVTKQSWSFEGKTFKDPDINVITNSTWDNNCYAVRTIQDGKYTVSNNGGGNYWNAPLRVYFKLSENLVPGNKYILSLNMYSPEGGYIQSGTTVFYNSTAWHDDNISIGATSAHTLYPSTAIVGATNSSSFALAKDENNIVEYEFTATEGMVAGGYIGYATKLTGNKCTYVVKGATLKTEPFSVVANYDMDNETDRNAIKHNMSVGSSTNSGTPLYIFEPRAFVGITGFELEQFKRYKIDINMVISWWGAGDIEAYAFPENARFTDTRNGVKIADLGAVDTVNLDTTPKKFSFDLSTDNCDIDFEQYPVLTLVINTNSGTQKKNIRVYDVKVRELNKAQAPAPEVTPKCTTMTGSRVIFKPVYGVLYGYSTNGTDYTWQESNDIKGLSGGTKYYFALKSKETGSFLESAKVNGDYVVSFTTYTKGDMNGDSSTNLLDLVHYKKYLAGYKNIKLFDCDFDSNDSNDALDLASLVDILIGR